VHAIGIPIDLWCECGIRFGGWKGVPIAASTALVDWVGASSANGRCQSDRRWHRE